MSDVGAEPKSLHDRMRRGSALLIGVEYVRIVKNNFCFTEIIFVVSTHANRSVRWVLETLVRLYVASSNEESVARRRIRRLSMPFEVAFTLIGSALLAVIVLILVLAYAPVGVFASIWVGPGNAYIVPANEAAPTGAVAFSALPTLTKVTAGLAFSLISGPLVAACYYLKKLFASYRQGDVFGKDPQVAMQKAAVALMTFALAPGLLQPVLRLAGSPDRQWFHSHSLAALMVGAVLLVLARVLVLGREVEDEAKGFI